MSHPSTNSIVATLSALAAAQNLRASAFKGCRTHLTSLTEDEPDYLQGWSVEEIEPHFRSYSLVLDELLGWTYVETQLDLHVPGADLGCPIGTYRLITRLDGTVTDDFLTIDMPRPIDT
ncbi:unnamed protein product [Gemmata massiliana]|uniref:Uncharacterized protein n=1 Tax=Gemmata massiliana TaxID=1210884 RepID=A0A6P2D4N5_9BACT|nr:hypothetical protein [Gemmata massiliana]VTR96258.1 unnamed protein product [Gemmata massiliana]